MPLIPTQMSPITNKMDDEFDFSFDTYLKRNDTKTMNQNSLDQGSLMYTNNQNVSGHINPGSLYDKNFFDKSTINKINSNSRVNI